MSKKTADDFVEIDKSNYKEYVFVQVAQILALEKYDVGVFNRRRDMRSRTVLYRIVRLAGNRAGRGKRARIGNSRCACSDFYRYRYLRQAGQIRRGGQHNSDYGIFQRGGCACA